MSTEALKQLRDDVAEAAKDATTALFGLLALSTYVLLTVVDNEGRADRELLTAETQVKRRDGEWRTANEAWHKAKLAAEDAQDLIARSNEQLARIELEEGRDAIPNPRDPAGVGLKANEARRVISSREASLQRARQQRQQAIEEREKKERAIRVAHDTYTATTVGSMEARRSHERLQQEKGGLMAAMSQIKTADADVAQASSDLEEAKTRAEPLLLLEQREQRKDALSKLRVSEAEKRQILTDAEKRRASARDALEDARIPAATKLPVIDVELSRTTFLTSACLLILVSLLYLILQLREVGRRIALSDTFKKDSAVGAPAGAAYYGPSNIVRAYYAKGVWRWVRLSGPLAIVPIALLTTALLTDRAEHSLAIEHTFAGVAAFFALVAVLSTPATFKPGGFATEQRETAAPDE